MPLLSQNAIEGRTTVRVIINFIAATNKETWEKVVVMRGEMQIPFRKCWQRIKRIKELCTKNNSKAVIIIKDMEVSIRRGKNYMCNWQHSWYISHSAVPFFGASVLCTGRCLFSIRHQWEIWPLCWYCRDCWWCFNLQSLDWWYPEDHLLFCCSICFDSQWAKSPSFCTGSGELQAYPRNCQNSDTFGRGAQYPQDSSDAYIFSRRSHWVHLSHWSW